MKAVPLKTFSEQEQQTWKMLFDRQTPLREQQMHPIFISGLEALDITAEKIPNLDEINEKLMSMTGWQGVAVEGLEEGIDFFEMLADKKFPIGNFIREQKDLSYTPAPDIFHDLYGHIPFYTDLRYADFCYRYGQKVLRNANNPTVLREYERFFWFTAEFALIQTAKGRRIFGAGIASSFGECAYALSDKPMVKPFSIAEIRNQEFRIDIIQEKLFELHSEEQLFNSLDTL